MHRIAISGPSIGGTAVKCLFLYTFYSILCYFILFCFVLFVACKILKKIFYHIKKI